MILEGKTEYIIKNFWLEILTKHNAVKYIDK